MIRVYKENYFTFSESDSHKKGFYNSLQEFEIFILSNIIEKTNGNKAQAAKILGMNRTTLIMKLKKYGIQQ